LFVTELPSAPNALWGPSARYGLAVVAAGAVVVVVAVVVVAVVVVDVVVVAAVVVVVGVVVAGVPAVPGSASGPLVRGAYAGLPTMEPVKTMFTHWRSVAT
jgi:hypothetical protein